MNLSRFIDTLHRPFQHSVTRFFSIILALSLSGLLLVYPGHIAQSTTELDHGYLSLLMFALSAVFVHGVGYNPLFWLWKILFSPYISWTVLLSFLYFRFI